MRPVATEGGQKAIGGPGKYNKAPIMRFRSLKTQLRSLCFGLLFKSINISPQN